MDALVREGFGDISWPAGFEAGTAGHTALKKLLASRKKKDPFEGILCPARKTRGKKKNVKTRSCFRVKS